MKRIGFIGLGLMGGAMAKNLLAAGYEVVGYDIEPAKVRAIVDAGGTSAPPERMDQKGYRMVRKQFLPAAGKTAFYYKDVRLMLALGEKLDCPLPLISLHAQALASEIAKGRAEWDSANIISFYDELANLGGPGGMNAG